MCENFPEVEKCCLCVPLRIGMLCISVCAIMTGVIMMCSIEKITDINYQRIKDVTDKAKASRDMRAHSGVIASACIAGIACVFMFTGIMLLIGTLSDIEDFAQVFVWLTFAAMVLSFFCVLVVGMECLLMPNCVLKGVDWLSGSAMMVLTVGYLFLWFYFIVVANSYVQSL